MEIVIAERSGRGFDAPSPRLSPRVILLTTPLALPDLAEHGQGMRLAC